MIISLTSRCIDIMRIMATESWIMLCYLLLSLARLRCDQSNYPANTSFTNNNNMFRLLGWTKGGPRQDHGHIFCDGDMKHDCNILEFKFVVQDFVLFGNKMNEAFLKL